MAKTSANKDSYADKIERDVLGNKDYLELKARIHKERYRLKSNQKKR